ncbi:hypothetical protein IAU60_002399 [Kwoniella sp. DSM 27419]
MRILLTGAAGKLGSHTLQYLLRDGHEVVAVDRVELHPQTRTELEGGLADLPSRMTYRVADLTSVPAVDKLFEEAYTNGKKLDGVIHLAAIPSPGIIPARELHNLNVTSSYNILYTACARGVKRITQASSVNAIGLGYTKFERQYYDRIPLTEEEPCRPEDEYSLSKQICELQADAMCRLYPDVRITSLRFHHIVPDISLGLKNSGHMELWAWVDITASARACLLGLTADQGWSTGHEAMYIVAPDIVWEGGLTAESKLYERDENGGPQVPALDLLDHHYSDKVKRVDRSWWAENPRRGFYDCSKAERLLGWVHDGQ